MLIFIYLLPIYKYQIMKKTLLFLFLFSCGLAQAQVANIPSYTLTRWLQSISPETSNYSNAAINEIGENITVDANRDYIIQESEAERVWGLKIDDSSINTLEGIGVFTNLRTLWITNSTITSLDISSLTHLEELYCDYNRLTELNLAGPTNLKRLRCGNNNFNSINLEGLSSLEELNCYRLGLTEIDLSGLNSLKILDLQSNNLSSIDLSGVVNLERLLVNRNPISVTLDLSHCRLLKSFFSSGEGPQYYDFTGLTELEEVHCSWSNTISSVTFGYHPHLITFICTATQILELDMSGCTALETLSIRDNTPLRFINLKNGPQVTFIDEESYQNIHQRFICVDESEVESFAVSLNHPNTNVNTYCSFHPGGDYNTIQGAIVLDSDNNGCDDTDITIPFARIAIAGNGISGAYYTTTGNYNFYTPDGTYTLTPQFENNWFTTTPAVVTFADINNNVTTQNFCVTANGMHNDAEVLVVPAVAAQPGFDATYKIIYKNKGNQTLSGDINFTYNDAVLDYVEASSVPSLSSAGTITWNYSDLQPFESREIIVTLNVNGPMEIPAVNNDDTLTFLAFITPLFGDGTPGDNTSVLNQTVVGSFDPNDITCLEGPRVAPNQIGEYLHYNINFENTGTAPATFIVLKDMIDAAKYDINTLQILDASHAMQVKVTGDKVEFIFDAINLPGEGKGNVTFKIKTLSTLAVNSSVTQQADIFFDYNWPIQTNEATTTFAVLSKSEYALDNSVTLSPNPANGIVNISAKADITSVQLYDVQGRLLQAAKGKTLDVSNRSAGLYFVKVTTTKGMKVEKLMRK